jgi:hypothetical protein
VDVSEQIICLHCVLSGRHVYAENIQLVVILTMLTVFVDFMFLWLGMVIYGQGVSSC